MNVRIAFSQPLHGALTLPTDKAICHRAALVSAICSGDTLIHPWPSAVDCRRTIELVEQLGVRADRVGNGIRVRGVGLRGLRPPAADLDCGESGTTMRLACGLLAAQSFPSRLTGAPGLLRRPMRRIVEPLTKMAARIAGEERAGEVYPPLAIRGGSQLRGVRHELSVASAQVKSTILLAGLRADSLTTVVEPSETRDHSERLLRHVGVGITQDGRRITLVPPVGDLAAPRELMIPGDVSSAAFFIVAASIVPGSCLTMRGVGLNPTRTHFIDVLRRMGASIEVTATRDQWEPLGDLTVRHARLRSIQLPPHEVPLVIDELPILMVAASVADGRSSFQALAELRVKETDRVRSMVEGLRRIGARIATDGPDGVTIEGAALDGGEVDSFGDHRTAMSLAVAGLAARSATTITRAECVDKSFPEFFSLLQQVTAASCIQTTDHLEGT